MGGCIQYLFDYYCFKIKSQRYSFYLLCLDGNVTSRQFNQPVFPQFKLNVK